MAEIRKQKYTTPKLNTIRGIPIGRKGLTYEHYLGFKKGYIYTKRGLRQISLDLMKEAKEAGIPIEEPLSFELKNANSNGYGSMIFLNAGTRVDRIIKSMPNLFLFNIIKEKTIKKMIDIVSALENIGIAHNHPHIKNFVYGDGKFKISDFTFAERVKVNWLDYRSLIKGFLRDYAHLKKTLYEDFKFDNTRVRSFFEILLGKYKKLPNSQKQKLLDEIMAIDYDLVINGTSSTD